MLCVPAVSEVVAHCAVRLLPLPVSATAEQPPIELAPSLKFTAPVGEVPVTVAVKVTFAPTVDGFSEVPSVVVVADAPFTTCNSAALVDPLLPGSPLYTAVMLWVPAVSALVAHCAVRMLPAPERATA